MAATPCTPPLSQLKTPPTHTRPSSCTLLRAFPARVSALPLHTSRSAPSLTLITIGRPQHYEQEEGREQRRRWVAYLRARERRTFCVRRVWVVWAKRGTGSGSHAARRCCLFGRFPLARRSAAVLLVRALPARTSICRTSVPTANIYMYTWTGRLIPRPAPRLRPSPRPLPRLIQ